MALYAFDGTWNERKDAGEYGRNTNVVRFVDAYTGKKLLLKGVGTKYSWLGKVFGGAFGAGGKERIRDASMELFKNYPDDPVIDIVGFSRGSALALHFANTISKKGVRNPETKEGRGDGAPQIRFLGLFDVVASFGIPINIGIPFHRINLGYELKLPGNVRHCFHALAMDELRQAFRPTRTPGGYEVWFRGVHSDIGGGNENLGLNDISFRWMLKKAVLAGLPIDATVFDGLRPDPEADIRPASLDIVKNKFRKLTTDDRFHYTVSPRTGEGFNNAPKGAGVESEDDEKEKLHL